MQVLRAWTALQDSSPQSVRLNDDQAICMLVCSLAMLAALKSIQPPRRRTDPPQPMSAQVQQSMWVLENACVHVVIPFLSLLVSFPTSQLAAVTSCQEGSWLEPCGQSCMQVVKLATTYELRHPPNTTTAPIRKKSYTVRRHIGSL